MLFVNKVLSFRLFVSGVDKNIKTHFQMSQKKRIFAKK